jgi:hypothetical protein
VAWIQSQESVKGLRIALKINFDAAIHQEKLITALIGLHIILLDVPPLLTEVEAFPFLPCLL